MTGIFQTRWTVTVVSLALAIVTVLVYLPVRHHAFLNWDDLTYIPNNDHIRGGVTWNGIVWSFTESYSANWCPLTWISYMLGCQIYGLSPAGHHLTNVILHAANTVFLFLVLRRLTSSIWRSAFVAALFGLAPVARGIRRMARRTQRRAEHLLSFPDDWCLQCLCP